MYFEKKLVLSGDVLKFTICNEELGGDPAKGYPKLLEVKYYHEFLLQTKSYAEYQTLNLP